MNQNVKIIVLNISVVSWCADSHIYCISMKNKNKKMVAQNYTQIVIEKSCSLRWGVGDYYYESINIESAGWMSHLPVSPSPYAAIESASSTSSSGFIRFEATE